MKPTVLTINHHSNSCLLPDNSFGDSIEVVNCHNGFEALTWLSSGNHTAQLLVVDMDMPSLNGYDFTNSIRKMKGMDDVPVVMISERDDYARRKSFRINNSEFVQKPVRQEDLMQKIITRINNNS